jgi:transcriptional regulator with XRE-family HTH domain
MGYMAHTIIPTWTLADRLVKARESAGKNQSQIADELGVGLRSIVRYEKGHHVPKRAIVLAWAMATNVDPEWLETGTPTDPLTRRSVSGKRRAPPTMPTAIAA